MTGRPAITNGSSVSITRRLLNLARSNLGALIDPSGKRASASSDGDALDGFSDEELQAELELRRVRRKRQDESRAARQQAEQAARERVRAQGAPAGSSTANARTGAAGTGATRGASPGGATAGGAGSARTAAGAGTGRASTGGSQAGRGAGSANSARPTVDRARLAVLYAQLETPAGADLDTVKRNFRRLMRVHHPDMNVGSPERQKVATERTARLTSAYDELERFLAPRGGR